jgi:hypothetical protein
MIWLMVVGELDAPNYLAPPRWLPEGVRRNVMLDIVTTSRARGYMCPVALAVVRTEES